MERERGPWGYWAGGCPEDNTDSEGVSPGIMEGNVLASERLRNAQPLS